MEHTEYKMIVIEKKRNPLHCIQWSLSGFVSRHPIPHKAAVASLSHRWSVIRPHPVRRRKGRMCIVSPFDGVEAARNDLRHPPFSLTKLRCGRAFATCSLP